jgi:hypothetical protein
MLRLGPGIVHGLTHEVGKPRFVARPAVRVEKRRRQDDRGGSGGLEAFWERLARGR